MRPVAAGSIISSLHAISVVFAEPAIPTEPSETAFYDPGQSGDLEGALPTCQGLQFSALATQQLTNKLAAFVTGISDHRVDSEKQRSPPG